LAEGKRVLPAGELERGRMIGDAHNGGVAPLPGWRRQLDDGRQIDAPELGPGAGPGEATQPLGLLPVAVRGRPRRGVLDSPLRIEALERGLLVPSKGGIGQDLGKGDRLNAWRLDFDHVRPRRFWAFGASGYQLRGHYQVRHRRTTGRGS